MLINNIVYRPNDEKLTLKVIAFKTDICIDQLKARDKDVFKLVYKQYSALLFGSILAKIGDESQASVILELTFIKAWETIDRFDESKCRLFIWLQRIAKNESQNLVNT